METFNIFHGETASEDGLPAGFHQREAALGPLLGGSRLGMSVYDLEPGDVVCFPTGPEGAHQVRNDSGERVRIAMFSEIAQGADATVYPDSDKLKIAVKDVLRRVRFSPHLDYWEGEE